MKNIEVKKIVQAIETSDGAGVKLKRSIGTPEADYVDPFLMLDEFGSENKDDYIAGFPPHPHRGIETVTYMLKGEFEHQDSTGAKGIMSSGDVQWMKTGRGIIHSEMPAMSDGKLLGFQLWINMPAKLKKNKPEYLYIKSDELGVHKDNEKIVKVVAGKYEKAEGPEKNHNVDPIYFHIVLNEKKEFTCEVPEGHNSFIYLLNGELKIGEKIFEELPQIDFGRIAAQSAKQVISSRVREAEKNRQYEDFIDKQGQILSGIIKRLEYGNVIVDLGKAEGVIKKDELIPREILKTGDRVKAYCYEVRKELKGHQIFLSRAHPQFLARLFFQEVPEIYQGTIEIKSVARDPGSRAKICVHSQDSSIDPVGACVGMKGSRIHGIVRELGNENIDVINHTNNLQLFISRALNPAKLNSMKIDEENKRVEVILNPEEVSKAIGRGGHNIRLAGQLTGYEIDVFREGVEEDVELTEFSDEIESWIIEELAKAGLDTAKSVLEQDVNDLVKRTDLEEETINDVLRILKEEFED